jgi:hypothetical protein
MLNAQLEQHVEEFGKTYVCGEVGEKEIDLPAVDLYYWTSCDPRWLAHWFHWRPPTCDGASRIFVAIGLVGLLLGMAKAASERISPAYLLSVFTLGTRDALSFSLGGLMTLAIVTLFRIAHANLSKATELLDVGYRKRISELLGSVGAPPLRDEALGLASWEMSNEQWDQRERVIVPFVESHVALLKRIHEVIVVLRLSAASRFGVTDSRHCDSLSIDRIEASSLSSWLRPHRGASDEGNTCPPLDTTNYLSRFVTPVSMMQLRKKAYTVLRQQLALIHWLAGEIRLDDTEPGTPMLKGSSFHYEEPAPAVVTLAMMRSMSATLSDLLSQIVNDLCCYNSTVHNTPTIRFLLQRCITGAVCSVEYLTSALSSSPLAVLPAENGGTSSDTRLFCSLYMLRHQTEMFHAAIMTHQDILVNTTTKGPFQDTVDAESASSASWDTILSIFDGIHLTVDSLQSHFRADISTSNSSEESEHRPPVCDTFDAFLPGHGGKEDTDVERLCTPPVDRTRDHITLVFSGTSDAAKQFRRSKRDSSRRDEGTAVSFPQMDMFDELRERLSLLPAVVERDVIRFDGDTATPPEEIISRQITLQSHANEQSVDPTLQIGTALHGVFLGELKTSLLSVANDETGADVVLGD